MEEHVKFKVFLEPVGEAGEREIRRFRMNKILMNKDVTTSFTYLTWKLRSVFSTQLERGAFTVSWFDEDKDKVIISSDEELAIALNEMPGPLYKLNVQLKVLAPNEGRTEAQAPDDVSQAAKKTESRYRCCFPECHFIINKTQMKKRMNLKHLAEVHKLKLKHMTNLPAGTFKFPKVL